MIQVFLDKSIKKWPIFDNRGLLISCNVDVNLNKRGLILIPLQLSIRYPVNVVASFHLSSEFSGILWYSDTLINVDESIVLKFFNPNPSNLSIKGKELGYITFIETTKYDYSISYDLEDRF